MIRFTLARFPTGCNHPVDKNSRQIIMLEHVLIEKVIQLFRNMLPQVAFYRYLGAEAKLKAQGMALANLTTSRDRPKHQRGFCHLGYRQRPSWCLLPCISDF